tara:strand:- start:296 stop:523 length:228 start_codon:yes stop_codon:yes gene_type:complete
MQSKHKKTYISALRDSHYEFIKGIKGIEIITFAKNEQFSSSHVYILSSVKVNNQYKNVISTYYPEEMRILNRIED